MQKNINCTFFSFQTMYLQTFPVIVVPPEGNGTNGLIPLVMVSKLAENSSFLVVCQDECFFLENDIFIFRSIELQFIHDLRY